jgi:hypothetical protein
MFSLPQVLPSDDRPSPCSHGWSLGIAIAIDRRTAHPAGLNTKELDPMPDKDKDDKGGSQGSKDSKSGSRSGDSSSKGSTGSSSSGGSSKPGSKK